MNQPEHYISCLQIKVVNGGTGTPGPTVKFPGAYKASDAYANFSIYNGFKSFPMPGPAVWSGGAASSGGGGASAPAPNTNTNPNPAPAPAANPAPGTACAPLYAQCGGNGYTGPKCCAQGTCKFGNPWYSQCLN